MRECHLFKSPFDHYVKQAGGLLGLSRIHAEEKEQGKTTAAVDAFHRVVRDVCTHCHQEYGRVCGRKLELVDKRLSCFRGDTTIHVHHPKDVTEYDIDAIHRFLDSMRERIQSELDTLNMRFSSQVFLNVSAKYFKGSLQDDVVLSLKCPK